MDIKTIRLKISHGLEGVRQQTTRMTGSIQGTLVDNKITAFWFTETVNFGDLITPMILRYYGFTPVYSSIEQAQVLSTGSVLQWASDDYSGHVLGSGLVYDTVHSLRYATIWAVRGELTKQRINAPRDVTLGDPGILSSKLLTQRKSKDYTLGIVPHYVDMKDARVGMIQKRYKNDVLVIDVMRRPSVVFDNIDKCEFILSSSLHGMIVADSFGIPNAWIYLSDNVAGKGFKFHDYYSALRMIRGPLYLDGNESLSQLLKCTTKPPDIIDEVKEELDNTFRSFKEYFMSQRGPNSVTSRL